MTFEEIVKYCLANPSYFKRSKLRLAKVLNIEVSLADKARKKARQILTDNNIKHYNNRKTRSKVSEATKEDYEKFLQANGINKEKVKSMKFPCGCGVSTE